MNTTNEAKLRLSEPEWEHDTETLCLVWGESRLRSGVMQRKQRNGIMSV